MGLLALRIEVDAFGPFFTTHIAPAHAAVIERSANRRRIFPALLHICNLLKPPLIRQYGME